MTTIGESVAEKDRVRAERKQADKKAREEIRNAVREAIVKRGITDADIGRAAAEMTREAVNNTLKERKLANLIDEEIAKVVRQSFPSATEVKSIIRGAVEREAARHAQEYVKNNIVLTVNEGGKYPEGGTF